MSKHSKKRRVRPRERQLLQLAKNGLVAVEIVHRAFFPNATAQAARSALRRLAERGLLRAEPLDANRVYYRLTGRGARVIGVSTKYAKALKKQGRAHRYAVSWFIRADRPGQRVVLDPLDYPDKFPVAGHSLPQGPFFLDRSDGCSRLGVILVDHNAHHRRMSHKTVALLVRFFRHGWFDDYIRQDAFAVAILTFSEDRKRTFQNHVRHAIGEQLGYPLSKLRPDLGSKRPQLVQVHVIPGLDSIVMHRDKKISTP